MIFLPVRSIRRRWLRVRRYQETSQWSSETSDDIRRLHDALQSVSDVQVFASDTQDAHGAPTQPVEERIRSYVLGASDAVSRVRHKAELLLMFLHMVTLASPAFHTVMGVLL